MDWLPGVVVGGIIGLISALVATEYTTCRDRQRRTTDIARSLSSEISSNRPVLERILGRVEKAKAEDWLIRHLVSPFIRDVYSSCVGDLALLPKDTGVAVQLFYGRLAGIEFIAYEGYLQETLLPPSEPRPPEERWKQLQDWLEERTRKALQAADEALAGLEKLTGQH